MSKFPHETKGFNTKFHGWYNMEPSPLLGLRKANPTSSFSSVDSEMLLKSIDQVREDSTMRRAPPTCDLNGEANEALYHASKQKTKADTFGERITFLNFELFQKRWGHIESYERSQEGEAEIEEECNKGFEDSH
ncbi:ion channel POLLUX-like 2 [Pyrus ussuriensis x Pyrus communis]|uniref:Ion channel POLLUX-like 2 n=1 Tax=Pyrus ussuriensis x Pyrus communis TaxID=2448454 RepID=A0A5N5IB48_9ROSA|nr:ion channel POLLUX-like 2 [Pyrus ussuriensis x Pyrus communis]